jgi:hypothetical protein
MPKPRYHYAFHNKPISQTICQQARLRKAFRKRWFSVKYNGNAKYGEFMVCYWENIGVRLLNGGCFLKSRIGMEFHYLHFSLSRKRPHEQKGLNSKELRQ